MNPSILAESQLLMGRRDQENFYYKLLRRVISYIWSSDGRYGVKFNYNRLSGNLYVKFACDDLVSYKIDGDNVVCITNRMGYECLVTSIKEYPTDQFACYYQISGYGLVKSVTELFANIEIIKSMFTSIQNIRVMFHSEAEKISMIPQSELNDLITKAFRYVEIDVVKEMIRLRGILTMPQNADVINQHLDIVFIS
jgi:hypothetical protein